MNIKISPEGVPDYNAIANVNYQAFLNWHPNNQYVSEPILVDLLRHSSFFDPELSLVAKLKDQIVGHALFTPFKFIVLGEEQMGVILGPIAVTPGYQRLGIGRQLIEEGHKRAKSKGYTFSLLCGHETYYPRFGYKTEMFSVSGSRVKIVNNDFSHEGFSERPVNDGDIPWIRKAWNDQHNQDSLALSPGQSISDWCNHKAKCCSTVISFQDKILGYARYAKTTPLIVKEILVLDENMELTLQYLGKGQIEFSVPLAANTLTKVLDPYRFQVLDNRNALEPFMIKVIENESLIDRYCTQVEAGSIQPGIIVFPSIFDLDDGVID